MKLSKMLMLTFMILIASSALCIEQAKNDREMAGLSGKVKRIRKFYESSEVKGQVLVYEAKYNSDGYLIESTTFNESDGRKEKQTHVFFNSDGLLVRSECFSSKKNSREITKFFYNSNNQLIKKVVQPANGKAVPVLIQVYRADGQLKRKKENRYDKNGQLTYSTIFEYDHTGNLKRDIINIYGSRSDNFMETTYFYNEKNLLSHKVGKSRIKLKEPVFNDARGNTKKAKGFREYIALWKGGQERVHAKTNFEYDEDGNNTIIEQIYPINPDINSRIIKKFDKNGNLILYKNYNSTGKIKELTLTSISASRKETRTVDAKGILQQKRIEVNSDPGKTKEIIVIYPVHNEKRFYRDEYDQQGNVVRTLTRHYDTKNENTLTYKCEETYEISYFE